MSEEDPGLQLSVGGAISASPHMTCVEAEQEKFHASLDGVLPEDF